MNNPKVSIIILNWNRFQDTFECLRSVNELDYPNYNIIVVDNASSDGSAEKIKNLFPQITLIKNEKNLGFAGGNNVGIKYALKDGAEYVWLLNNDAVVEKDSLSSLVHKAEDNPSIGMVSPLIYYYSDKNKIQFCGSIANKNTFSVIPLRSLQDLDKFKEQAMSLWGTALLVNRSVITKIGGLGEKFFAYGEDTDFSIRAIDAGYIPAVDVQSKVYHKNEYLDPDKLPLHYFFYKGRNEFLLWWDNVSGVSRLKFLRKYLFEAFNFISKNLAKNRDNIVDVYLDGMYCAFRRVQCSCQERVYMPKLAKRIIKKHPYFFARIFSGFPLFKSKQIKP